MSRRNSQKDIAISRVNNLISNWDNNNNHNTSPDPDYYYSTNTSSIPKLPSPERYYQQLQQKELDDEHLEPEMVPGRVNARGELVEEYEDHAPFSSSDSPAAKQWVAQNQYADYPLREEDIESQLQKKQNADLEATRNLLSKRFNRQAAHTPIPTTRNSKNETNTTTSTSRLPSHHHHHQQYAATSAMGARNAAKTIEQGRKLQSQQEVDEKLGFGANKRRNTTPVLDPSLYALKNNNTAQNRKSNNNSRSNSVNDNEQANKMMGPVPPEFAHSPRIFKNSQERDDFFQKKYEEERQMKREQEEAERKRQEEEEEKLIDPPPFEDDGTSTVHRYVLKDVKTGKILKEGEELVRNSDGKVLSTNSNNKNRTSSSQQQQQRDPPGTVRLYLDDRLSVKPRMQVSVYSPNRESRQPKSPAHEKLLTRERERKQMQEGEVERRRGAGGSSLLTQHLRSRTPSATASSSNHLLVSSSEHSKGRLVPSKELPQIELRRQDQNKNSSSMPAWLQEQYAKMNKKKSKRTSTPGATSSTRSSSVASTAPPDNEVDDKFDYQNSYYPQLKSNNISSVSHLPPQLSSPETPTPHEQQVYRERIDIEEAVAEVLETDQRAQLAHQRRQNAKMEYDDTLDAASFKRRTAQEHIREGERLMAEAEREARRLAKIEEQANPHLYRINNDTNPMSPNAKRVREERWRKFEEEKQAQAQKWSTSAARKSKTPPPSFRKSGAMFSRDQSVHFTYQSSNTQPVDISTNDQDDENTTTTTTTTLKKKVVIVDPHLTLPNSPRDAERIQRQSERRRRAQSSPLASKNAANGANTTMTSGAPVHSRSHHPLGAHSVSSTGNFHYHVDDVMNTTTSSRNKQQSGASATQENEVAENFWSNDVSSMEARNDPDLSYGRISWRKGGNDGDFERQQRKQREEREQQQHQDSKRRMKVKPIPRSHPRRRNGDGDEFAEEEEEEEVDEQQDESNFDRDGTSVIITQKIEDEASNKPQVVHFISALGGGTSKSRSPAASRAPQVPHWQGNMAVRNFMGDLMSEVVVVDEEDENQQQNPTCHHSNKKQQNELSHATLKERHEEFWEAIPGAQNREQEDISKMSVASRSAHIQWRDSLRDNTRSQVRYPLATAATAPLLEVDSKMYSTVKPLPIDERGRVIGAPFVVQKEINAVGSAAGGTDVVISAESLNHSKHITDKIIQNESSNSNYPSFQRTSGNEYQQPGGIESIHISAATSVNDGESNNNNNTRPEWNNDTNTNISKFYSGTASAALSGNNNASQQRQNQSSATTNKTEEWLERKRQLWRERASKKRAEELRLQNEMKQEAELRRGSNLHHEDRRLKGNQHKNLAATSLSGTQSFAAPLSGRVKGMRRRSVTPSEKYRVAVAALEKVCDENERRRNLLGGDGIDEDGNSVSTKQRHLSSKQSNLSRNEKTGVAVEKVASPTTNQEDIRQVAEEAKRMKRQRQGGGDSFCSPTGLGKNVSFSGTASVLDDDQHYDNNNNLISSPTSRSGSTFTSYTTATGITNGATTTIFGEGGDNNNNNNNTPRKSKKLSAAREAQRMEKAHLAYDRAEKFTRQQPIPGPEVKTLADERMHHSVMSPQKVAKFLPENYEQSFQQRRQPPSSPLSRNKQQQQLDPNTNMMPIHFYKNSNNHDDDEEFYIAGRAKRREPVFVEVRDNEETHEEKVARLRAGGSSSNYNVTAPSVGSNNIFLQVPGGAGGGRRSPPNLSSSRTSAVDVLSNSNNNNNNNNNKAHDDAVSTALFSSSLSNRTGATTTMNNNNNNNNKSIILDSSKNKDVVAAKAVTRALRAAAEEDELHAQGKSKSGSKPAWMLSATEEDEKAERERQVVAGNFYASSSGSPSNNNNNTSSFAEMDAAAAAATQRRQPWASFRNPTKSPPKKKIFGHVATNRKF